VVPMGKMPLLSSVSLHSLELAARAEALLLGQRWRLGSSLDALKKIEPRKDICCILTIRYWGLVYFPSKF
jgi:hypothetical protein